MAASAVDTIFDQLGSMSVLELVELKKKALLDSHCG